MQCIAVIIQLVSRDHICRFESESEMRERKGKSCSNRVQHGYELIEK
jgi:hypothetical protein